jgi:predicted helicase
MSGMGARNGFSALMTNMVPNFHTLDTGQCFPMFLYEETEGKA